MTVFLSTILVLLLAGWLMEGTINPLKWPARTKTLYLVMLAGVGSSVLLPYLPL